MRETLREFLAALPEVLRRWVLIAVPIGVLLFLLLENWNAADAIASAARVVGYGVCLLGFVWIDPLSHYVRPSWKRFAFACLWFAVTLLPAIALGTILGGSVDVLFASFAP